MPHQIEMRATGVSPVLPRIGKQLEQEVVKDREAPDSGQFKAQGGFQ